MSTLAQQIALRDSMQWMLAHESGIYYSMGRHGELLRIGEAALSRRFAWGRLRGGRDDPSGHGRKGD